jgi:hypothetical protein
MASKIYKYLFKFFNLICVLSINFNGKIFTSPNSLRFKSVAVICSVLVFKKILNDLENMPNPGEGKALTKIVSIFFLVLVPFLVGILKFMPYLCTFMLLIQQKRIAEIFTKFYELKISFDDEKVEINENVSAKKIKKLFWIYLIFIILMFDIITVTSVKKQIYAVDVLLSIIDHTIKTYTLFCLYFYNIILIHYQFLLETTNEILENKFSCVHENCEKFLKKLYDVRKLFNLLNKTFGILFTLEAFNKLINMIGFVSLAFHI